MKGAQSSTSNVSFPFLIRGSLGPKEGDFKLWVVKLQSKALVKTFSLEPPTARENWTFSCKTVLSLHPPSLLGNHPSCLGVKDRERTSLHIIPKEEGKLGSNQGNFSCLKTPAEPKARRYE